MKKFGLIGCGEIAEVHAENICRIGTLVAVCDVKKEKRDTMATRFGANAYATIEDLLKEEKEIEIISVCTPTGLHAEHVIKSLQARKHVLCEQPLCLTAAAAWQIIETEKFCRRKLFVVSTVKRSTLLQALRQLLIENRLGKIYSVDLNLSRHQQARQENDWRGKLFPGGGTLYTTFSPFVSTLPWLFGDVAEVSGFRTNAAHQQSTEFEDTGIAALAMQNGIVGTLRWSVNASPKNEETTLTVYGEKGSVCIDGEELQHVKYNNTGVDLPKAITAESATAFANTAKSVNHYREVYDNLLSAIDTQSNDTNDSVFDALKTVETIEKIYKSIPLR